MYTETKIHTIYKKREDSLKIRVRVRLRRRKLSPIFCCKMYGRELPIYFFLSTLEEIHSAERQLTEIKFQFCNTAVASIG